MEKLKDIAYALESEKLAKKGDGPWYDVETETAAEFMMYLSVTLGRIPHLQFTPITDQLDCLNKLYPLERPAAHTEREIGQLRLEILEEALPAPSKPITVSEIQIFKQRYGEKLSNFRYSIESQLTALAAITEFDLRQRQLDLLKKYIREETKDIQEKMKAHGWGKTAFNNIMTILAALPVIGTVPKLFNAFEKVFESNNSFDKHSPLVYAAYAQKDLLGSI